MTFDAGNGPFILDEHQFAVLESSSPITASSTGPSARVEGRLLSRRLGAEEFRFARERPFDVPEPFWQLAVATLNTLIAAPPDTVGGGSARIRNVLEELILTLLAEVHANELTAASSQAAQLQREATRLIGLHSGDPVFSVQLLASQLAVSQTHLHRIFAELGTTPRKAIERARVRAAREALEQAGAAPAAVIADRSGFTSVRQMRAALQRWL